MSKQAARVFSQKFKLQVLGRMEAGENVCALARELGVHRRLFYAWREAFRRGGLTALRGRGRPRHRPRLPQRGELATVRKRIGELERKIDELQLALDLFNRALSVSTSRRRTYR